jgi:hypothetical protein
MLLFYSEIYGNAPDIDRTLTKGRLYEILKVHYRIENTRAIKNQVEMLKADGIMIEQEERLHLVMNADMLLKVYRIIMEAPDDIFPIYQREIDFFHYVVKIPSRGPKDIWDEVLTNRRHPDNESDEVFYGKEELFKLMISGYFSFVDWYIKPYILSWCALRYLAKAIYEDLRTGFDYSWPYPEIEKIKKNIEQSIGKGADYEDIFESLKEQVNFKLSEKIARTVFPFVSAEEGIEYIVMLGSSPSALYFFFDIGRSKPDLLNRLISVNTANKTVYSHMRHWLISLLMRDFIENEYYSFRFDLEGRTYTLNMESLGIDVQRFPGVF